MLQAKNASYNTLIEHYYLCECIITQNLQNDGIYVLPIFNSQEPSSRLLEGIAIYDSTDLYYLLTAPKNIPLPDKLATTTVPAILINKIK
jgi:hypothetical protein